MKSVGLFKGLIFLIIMLIASSSYAQNYQLHTVYIYSFIRYVQWPMNDGDFVIGVVGDSPIIQHLEKMAAAKKAGARNIVVKLFPSSESVEATDIMFVSKSASAQLRSVDEKLSGANTLIITEHEGAALDGSGINFVERDGKLAFELNKATVEKAGLKVSSELTRLAIVI